MYCVIQEVNRKTPSKGNPKRLEVDTYTINNKIIYSYYYSEETFERPIKKAYKITIHHSFRENQKVKKKQYSICTIGYYDFVDGMYYDTIEDKTKDLSKKLQMSEDKLTILVYEKLNPLKDKIILEYEKSEEGKACKMHKSTIKKYHKAKSNFEQKFGYGTFDCCYDVFLNLRNSEYLDKLMGISSYQKQKKNSNHTSSSYQNKKKKSNHSKSEKEILNSVYKELAMKFHPDKNNNSEESLWAMKIINEWKEGWNI